MRIDRLKLMAHDLLANGYSAVRSRTTSRDTLLAVGEYMRRVGGDALPVPDTAQLNGFELKVFSQNGEDGVVAECLRRAGIAGGSFVEFGAGAGIEGNCVVLADVLSWSGLFVEAEPRAFQRLQRKYAPNLRVTTRQAWVTEENVEEVFAAARVPLEPDVLSIDIDGADYWVWRALSRYRPRIVVIEYNSSCSAEKELVQPRHRSDSWDRTDYFGASIAALRRLGESKDYRLVHTDMTGTNAFFVRNDLAGDWPEPSLVPLRGVNYFLAGVAHPSDPQARAYVEPGTV